MYVEEHIIHNGTHVYKELIEFSPWFITMESIYKDDKYPLQLCSLGHLVCMYNRAHNSQWQTHIQWVDTLLTLSTFCSAIILGHPVCIYNSTYNSQWHTYTELIEFTPLCVTMTTIVKELTENTHPLHFLQCNYSPFSIFFVYAAEHIIQFNFYDG